MRRVIAYLMVPVVLAGCQKHVLSEAPRFNLDSVPVQTSCAFVSVAIEDARPDWERQPFQGVFSLVPLENLAPSPLELVRRHLERQAEELHDPPRKVSLDLQSLRAVISTEDSFLHHDRKFFNPLGFLGSVSSDHGGGAADLIGLLCFVSVVGAVEVGIYTFDVATEFIHDRQHVRSRPKELIGDYHRGATCDLQATVSCEWPDGRRSIIPLREVVNHVERDVEYMPRYTTQDALRDCVREACEQLARDWRERLLHPESNAGSGQPVPVFTVHSTN